MNYPRVTSIIAPWSGLDKIPEATLQYAADRGTRVHEICSRIAQGEFVMNLDEDCRPYVDSFRHWFSTQVGEVVLAEERLIDEGWGYTGQIDLLVRLKEGATALVDLKTPVLAYKQWRLQLSAYHNLVVEAGFTPEKCGSLQLSPRGKVPRMKWYENTALDFTHFTMALGLYRFFHEGGQP